MQDAVAAEPRDAVPEPEPVIAECRMSRSELAFESVFLAGYAVGVTAGFMVGLVSGQYGMAAFMAVCMGIAAHMIHWFGWRVPIRLEMTRTTLRWVAPFRRAEAPLLSVRRVHLAFSRNKAKKLVIDGARPVPLYYLHDVDPFLSVLTTAAPGIEVRPSPQELQRRLRRRL